MVFLLSLIQPSSKTGKKDEAQTLSPEVWNLSPEVASQSWPARPYPRLERQHTAPNKHTDKLSNKRSDKQTDKHRISRMSRFEVQSSVSLCPMLKTACFAESGEPF